MNVPYQVNELCIVHGEADWLVWALNSTEAVDTIQLANPCVNAEFTAREINSGEFYKQAQQFNKGGKAIYLPS